MRLARIHVRREKVVLSCHICYAGLYIHNVFCYALALESWPAPCLYCHFDTSFDLASTLISRPVTASNACFSSEDDEDDSPLTEVRFIPSDAEYVLKNDFNGRSRCSTLISLGHIYA